MLDPRKAIKEREDKHPLFIEEEDEEGIASVHA